MSENVSYLLNAGMIVGGAIALYAGVHDAGSPRTRRMYQIAIWLTLGGTIAFGWPAIEPYF